MINILPISSLPSHLHTHQSDATLFPIPLLPSSPYHFYPLPTPLLPSSPYHCYPLPHTIVILSHCYPLAHIISDLFPIPLLPSFLYRGIWTLLPDDQTLSVLPLVAAGRCSEIWMPFWDHLICLPIPPPTHSGPWLVEKPVKDQQSVLNVCCAE